MNGPLPAVDRRQAVRRDVELIAQPDGPARASAYVCEAVSCLSTKSHDVLLGIGEQVAERGMKDIAVKRVGCLGLCAEGPLVQIPETGEFFRRVGLDDVGPIVAALAAVGDDPARVSQQPFFARQVRIATENSGRVDPESVEDYVAVGGYAALRRALTSMTPAEVREEVVRSGLRGRGGAGYSAGLKWNTVAKAAGAPKYVICNADEGDPGAFMDRNILESDPHRVLEGMAIAAFAVGASSGYVYCRGEYPLVVSRVRKAIKDATRAGYLGARIMDTEFSFELDVRLGAGAYVCGEETALIASIEGGRGSPIPRPPYPAVAGLWHRPTLINNVETLANIAPIVRNGGDWFASIGTATSKGTKVFAIAGRVVNTGIVEIPMGTTLREIVFDIGGGIVDGRAFKAVQTGGPAGGCIPAEFLDMPVDYESLMGVGSFMGSGGMIVMDETSCMVDVAKFFMDFMREESCGKCAPCRVGTTQLWMMLDAITRGEATMVDLTRMEKLAGMVQRTSLCGLGQGAPNPIFSTIRHFRDEYVAHIVDRVCPAGVCKMSATAVLA
ncbi:MAG TPA: NuoF family protein [Candidatus Limnocylindrales bacterium]|nr:NuoF family protein [Candidatus Limnocylindrales bacterium]